MYNRVEFADGFVDLIYPDDLLLNYDGNIAHEGCSMLDARA